MLPHHVTLKTGRSAIVRAAVPADVESLIEVLNSVAVENLYLMAEPGTRSAEEFRRTFLDARPSVGLWMVGEVDGTIVAGANVRRGEHLKNAHTARFGVFVRPEFRGLGLGDFLLREAIDWARRSGIAKLKLGVFSTNERAIALYRKFGFQEEGRLKGEVILSGRPVDEILMALWLERSDPDSTDPNR